MTLLYWLALVPALVTNYFFVAMLAAFRRPPHLFYLVHAAAALVFTWGLINLSR